MSNPVTNFEIAGAKSKTLSLFYENVFNWKMNAYQEGYYWFKTGSEDDKGIEGHIYPPNEEMKLIEGVPFGNNPTIYVAVEDIHVTVEKLESLGGIVLMPPTVVSDKGELIGMFLDPSGNRIGLYAPNSKRGGDSNG